jgi:hypothetical protein
LNLLTLLVLVIHVQTAFESHLTVWSFCLRRSIVLLGSMLFFSKVSWFVDDRDKYWIMHLCG